MKRVTQVALVTAMLLSGFIDDPIPNGPLRPAARTFDQAQLTPPPPPPPPPVPTGLWGQPFAPEGLSDCDEMNFYRAQWGLPEAFAGIGWRESNCRNEDSVKTFCCHGYWQMYTSLHMTSSILAPKMRACGVYSHHDLNSDIPIEKQRQACAAKSLYDTSGTSPWSATR